MAPSTLLFAELDSRLSLTLKLTPAACNRGNISAYYTKKKKKARRVAWPRGNGEGSALKSTCGWRVWASQGGLLRP